MLPEKPWRIEAIVRLGLGILVCQFLAATAFATLQFSAAQSSNSPWLFGLAVAGSVIFAVWALVFLGKSWGLEQFNLETLLLKVMFGFMGSLACSAAAQQMAGRLGDITTLRAVVGALSFQGAAVVLLPRFLRQHQIGWREAFGFTTNWRIALLFGALGALIFLPVGWGLQLVSVNAMARFGLKPDAQTAVQVLTRAESWEARFALGLVTICLAPAAEEILFRGILYPAVKRLGYPRIALWSISVLFALIHFNLPTFLPLLVMAIMLTRLYESTGNLLAPITLHCLFNGANFFWFFFGHKLPKWVPFHP